MAVQKIAAAASTLAASLVTSVGNALADAYQSMTNSGTALGSACAAAAKLKLPTVVSQSDVDAIVDAISTRLQWAGTARERTAKSEMRAIVATHATLPEAITALRSASGRCGLAESVKLARYLRDGKSVKAAVTAMTTHVEAKRDPREGIRRSLQSFFNATRDSKRKDRDVVMQACIHFAGQ